jgi:hypothetical protein
MFIQIHDVENLRVLTLSAAKIADAILTGRPATGNGGLVGKTFGVGDTGLGAGRIPGFEFLLKF